VLASGVSFSVSADQGGLQIAVSIASQIPFVERIGGENVEVEVMVPPGSSPSTYEPTFQQMAALEASQVYFTLSVPFEDAWLRRIAESGPDLQIVAMDRDIDKMPIGGYGSQGSGRADPHHWLSPPYMRIMAITIYETLAEIDPANASYYFNNYRALAQEINDLDSRLLASLDDIEWGSNAFMVFHPAWGYFARAYGMEQVAIETRGGEPTQAELAELVDFARERGVQVIFTAPQYSARSAEAIAEEVSGFTVSMNPVDPDWFGSMEAALEAFLDALE